MPSDYHDDDPLPAVTAAEGLLVLLVAAVVLAGWVLVRGGT